MIRFRPLRNPLGELVDLSIDHLLASSVCYSIGCHKVRRVISTRYHKHGSFGGAFEGSSRPEFRRNGRLAPRVITAIGVDQVGGVVNEPATSVSIDLGFCLARVDAKSLAVRTLREEETALADIPRRIDVSGNNGRMAFRGTTLPIAEPTTGYSQYSST